jgi:hypothetical protein
MITNAEFRKNLWLELSFSRLILMPLILGAVFFITYLQSDGINDFMKSLRIASMVSLCILAFAWGGKMVAESVTGEFNEGTWDFQRMSAVGAWEMASGKLFGSAIYPWYGSLFSACAYLVSAFFLEHTLWHLKALIIVILGAVMIHAAVLSLSLMGIRKNQGRGKINSSGYVMASIVMLAFLGPALVSASSKNNVAMAWYSITLPFLDFILYSTLFFLMWALIGLYRNMRVELQQVNGPWMWTLFLLSLMLYASGLTANMKNEGGMEQFVFGLWISYIIGAAMTYFMAFIEPKDMVDFRVLLDKLKRAQWRDAGEHFPVWFISLVFSIALCGMIIFVTALGWIDKFEKHLLMPGLWFFNTLLFMLRDLSMLIYVNLSKNRSPRADVAVMIYLLILYLLIPLMVKMANMESLLPMFIPIFERNILNGTLPILFQAVFMILLVFNQWELRTRSFEVQKKIPHAG